MLIYLIVLIREEISWRQDYHGHSGQGYHGHSVPVVRHGVGLCLYSDYNTGGFDTHLKCLNGMDDPKDEATHVMDEHAYLTSGSRKWMCAAEHSKTPYFLLGAWTWIIQGDSEPNHQCKTAWSQAVFQELGDQTPCVF